MNRSRRKSLLTVFVAIALAAAIAIPIVRVFTQSFSPEVSDVFGAYIDLYSDPRTWSVIANTVVFALGSVSLALLIASGLALLATRTNMPWTRGLSILPVLSLLIPAIVGATGWLLLMSPRAGAVNVLVRAMAGMDSETGPFSLYSLTAMTLVNVLYLVPIAYVFVLAGLNSMDASLEEASAVAGASSSRTIRSITVPLVAPAITTAAILLILMALGEVSIPIVVGVPARVSVVGVEAWRAATQTFPQDYVGASVYAMAFVPVALLGIFTQRRILRRGGFDVVGARGHSRGSATVRLGKVARKLAVVAAVGYLVIAVVVPLAAVLYGSLLRFFTANVTWESFTLDNYRNLLTGTGISRVYQQSLVNSLVIAVSGATIAVGISALLGYLIVHSRGKGRTILDYVSFMPAAIPNILFGVGFLLLFIAPPFRLYGTPFALMIAYLVIFSAIGVRASVAAMHQLSRTPEEASRVAGGSWSRTYWRVTLPLTARGLAAGWIILFVFMSRELSVSIFLAGPGTPVIAASIVNGLESADFGLVSAISMILVVITAVIVWGANRLADRAWGRR